jgi:hypothetical protein
VRLLVAAGGGGDALAAAVIANATPQAGAAAGIATLAWDRLIIDPLPGPRIAADFTNLDARDGYTLVTPTTRPVAPAGSTLPRLAADLPVPVIFLDPSAGAVGLGRQITAAADDLGCDAIELVDVGGDVLGRPGDPGLRSPLADGLTAAACPTISTTLYVAGPGLDGELPEAEVIARLHQQRTLMLDASDWEPYIATLTWHPSEATALLAAASHGVRGQVEIRDAGLPVLLTEHSPSVFTTSLAAADNINPLISALRSTTTLDQAEQAVCTILGTSELDYERAKSGAGKPRQPKDVIAAALDWCRDARRRGVDFVTYRRLAEALGATDVERLRQDLVGQQPDMQAPLLWPTGVN